MNRTGKAVELAMGECAVDVVIPSYNGRMLLERLIANLDEVGLGSCITVVDDASTDGSVEFVRSRFPEVRVIARSENGGFSAAVNDGIRSTQGEFVLVLNNDVEVTRGFLEPLVSLFDDESVFAVSPSIMVPALGNLDDGAKRAVWHHGILYVDHVQGIDKVKPVFFVSGCASLYRRSMLEVLSGFSDSFAPFYWEDVDLSYRAWKRGWKSLYQPASEVLHAHSVTLSKMPRLWVDTIKARNQFLFIWRNIEDPDLIRQHRRWLLLVLAKRLVLGDRAFLRGWSEAKRRRGEALKFRAQDSQNRVLSDREIFAMTESVF
ncbi:MAG: glycosyltransferase family 2 protein [Armatimonadota bacterium]|nr:glycosyltransferase family 2 protein [Armatimonadota bacterium]